MSKQFTQKISSFVRNEIRAAEDARQRGDAVAEFSHLENAHVLGQESTYWHVKVHLKMLYWGVRNRSAKEVAGQVFRIVGAATKTFIGLIPEGNTGGANVSPFRRMPISAEYREIIAGAKHRVS